MKKLLIVAQSLGGGGTEVAMTEFLNHLDDNLYDITLVLIDKNKEYEYRLKRNVNIKYIKFDNDFYRRLASTNSLEGKVFKKLRCNKYFDLYHLISKHSEKLTKRYDIGIDFYGYGSFTTVYLALNVKANRKAFWLHDEQMPWISNIEKYFKYYDKIFGVSKAITQTFNKLYPNESTKSEVLYNVIDSKKVIENSKLFIPKELSNNTFNIVTVGRLTEQKGYDIAVKVAKKLNEKQISFKWFVIGEGKDRKKLDKLINKNGLNNQFILLGRKDNPYPYIKNCDIYVQPSRHEGYGLAVLEARILKKPIIVSDLNAFKEQIINNSNGIISKLDPEALTKNIIKLYFGKSLRQKMSNFPDNVDSNSGIRKFNQFSSKV